MRRRFVRNETRGSFAIAMTVGIVHLVSGPSFSAHCPLPPYVLLIALTKPPRCKKTGTGQRTHQVPHCESPQKWQGPGNYNGWRKKMAPWYGRSVGRPAESATVSLPLSPATFKRVYQAALWWLIAGITANLDRRQFSPNRSSLFGGSTWYETVIYIIVDK